ncbi:MAG: glycoside hydrolase N-terminal domain-containing protein [Verrucomicrobia bacterium]|nr:glycoside hydrolase N-terminal domain-containing protein [Verrucomicrobiota bacterium]MDA1004933.1 glycoside hydrolase N-terminal domain-containing protein [Verrucomicrobiota bacterium]
MFATLAFAVCSISAASAQHEFWYQQPAKDWNEALPVGNGRMGAMIFGNPDKERIQLNEDSLWPVGAPDRNVKGTPADLAKARQLITDGNLAEASSFVPKAFSFGEETRSHQTLGDLHIAWQNTDRESTDTRRSLDLSTAVSTTTWKRGDTTFTQEVFCSNPDEALFIKLTADGPGTLDFDLSLDRPEDEGQVTHSTVAVDNSLEMTGQVTQRTGTSNGPHPDMVGVTFLTRLHAATTSGTTAVNGDTLQVRGAREVDLRLTATTDFWSTATQKAHLTKHSARVGPESKGIFLNEARKRHIADHQSLYNRCVLNLPTEPELDKLPTDRRLAQLKPDQSDLGLEALIFHYGRYLLIASSRPNSNPANLQGLWHDKITAPWNADYHLNINLQMNYWPADVTNISETELPLFTWMKALAKNGAVTAKEQYNMRGWMCHHATDLDAHTGMISATAHWGSWIHGGGWLCQHIWTYYEFTQDKEFLKNTGYPLLAGQARFYLDWLVEKDGKLISSFETSPENSFINTDGKRSAICAKGAMGQQIITEELTNTLAAAKELGIDDDFTKEIAAALSKIDNGLHIGPDGRILEWDKSYKEAESGHRHLSHLYAFHPGSTITQEGTPELLAAAKQSLDFRESHGSVDIGWSRAWAISIYARLRDGNRAHKHLHEMLRTQTLLNGFNSVFGKGRPVFQIEANLGATAGIAEMLVQSHGGFIHLLPALPESWPNGSIADLKARGGYTIGLAWENGTLTTYKITHPTATSIRLKIANAPISEAGVSK